MNILYIVPWVDVEFGWGSKPDGYRVYKNFDEMVTHTKESSKTGLSNGGYYGPEKPLSYYEIPYDKQIAKKTFVDDVEFKSNIKFIK